MTLTREQQQVEWLRCHQSLPYFVNEYVRIYDAESANWIPFRIWPEQAQTLNTIKSQQLTIILKARQLGITWLCLSYALWRMLYRPVSDVLLFSRRDDEAVHLLDERLKGMYRRLPTWMQARKITTNNAHMFGLSNGSIARAFPTNAGDSYTATLAVVDEADLVPELNKLLRSVKPTIDTGGQMVLLSRSNKEEPQSEFKRIFRSAEQGTSSWAPVFLPWNIRPSRTQAWYEEQRRDSLARTGSLDDLYEQYPATADEALAFRTTNRRIPYEWLKAVYNPLPPVQVPGGDEGLTELLTGDGLLTGEDAESLTDEEKPSVTWRELAEIYVIPSPYDENARYIIGADPAEGNPTSDDSVAVVVDFLTGQEVAQIGGHYQPNEFAEHISGLARYYNNAAVLVERNNHGHAVLLRLRQLITGLLSGPDKKEGWLTTSLGKALLYNTAAETIRQGDCSISSRRTLHQLSLIEGSTLKAPTNEHDDYAIAFCLAQVGRTLQATQDQVILRTGNDLYGTRESVAAKSKAHAPGHVGRGDVREFTPYR